MKRLKLIERGKAAQVHPASDHRAWMKFALTTTLFSCWHSFVSVFFVQCMRKDVRRGTRQCELELHFSLSLSEAYAGK
jgi:hypothetical protein